MYTNRTDQDQFKSKQKISLFPSIWRKKKCLFGIKENTQCQHLFMEGSKTGCSVSFFIFKSKILLKITCIRHIISVYKIYLFFRNNEKKNQKLKWLCFFSRIFLYTVYFFTIKTCLIDWCLTYCIFIHTFLLIHEFVFKCDLMLINEMFSDT